METELDDTRQKMDEDFKDCGTACAAPDKPSSDVEEDKCADPEDHPSRSAEDSQELRHSILLNKPHSCSCGLCHSWDPPLALHEDDDQGHKSTENSSIDRWSYAETIDFSVDSNLTSCEDLTDSVVSIPLYLWEQSQELDASEEVWIQERIDVLRRQLMDHLFGDEDEEDESDEEQKILRQVLKQFSQKFMACQICLESGHMFERPCCGAAVCNDCMQTYLTGKIENGMVMMECPMSQCKQLVSRDEVNARLPLEIRVKFQRFLLNLNKEEHQKTCPRCSHLASIDPALVKRRKFHKQPYLMDCEACQLKWCFPCHAPWHEGISCKQFRKGDRLLQSWAKKHEHGQANARKCPSCKVYIQRTSGCAHMKCTKCKTNFCYKCGGRYLGSSYLGRHMDKYSIFGCKYGYKPNKPVQRRLVRGSIFTGKILATPLIATLAVGAGALLIATSVFYVPVLVSRKIYREHRARKLRAARLRYLEERKKYLQVIRNAGDPYLEQFQRMTQLGCHLDVDTRRINRTDHFKGAGCDRDSLSSTGTSSDGQGCHDDHVVQVEAITEQVPEEDPIDCEAANKSVENESPSSGVVLGKNKRSNSSSSKHSKEGTSTPPEPVSRCLSCRL